MVLLVSRYRVLCEHRSSYPAPIQMLENTLTVPSTPQEIVAVGVTRTSMTPCVSIHLLMDTVRFDECTRWIALRSSRVGRSQTYLQRNVQQHRCAWSKQILKPVTTATNDRWLPQCWLACVEHADKTKQHNTMHACIRVWMVLHVDDLSGPPHNNN